MIRKLGVFWRHSISVQCHIRRLTASLCKQCFPRNSQDGIWSSFDRLRNPSRPVRPEFAALLGPH